MTDKTHEEMLREIVKDTIDRLSPAAQSAIRRVREYVLTDEEGQAYAALPRHIRESWGFTTLGEAVRVELERQEWTPRTDGGVWGEPARYDPDAEADDV